MINEDHIMEELQTLAMKLRVKVTFERFFGNGGLCKIGDDYRLIINKDLPIEKKNEIITEELGKFNLENVYVTPVLRKILGCEDSYEGLENPEEEVPVGNADDSGDIPESGSGDSGPEEDAGADDKPAEASTEK